MQRTSAYGLGMFLALSAVIPAPAVPQTIALQSLDTELLAQETSQTLLRFETQHYLVRVYQSQGQTFLNVYNKETGFTDLNSALAQRAPARDDEDNWCTYVNQRGDLHYYARVHPEGMTELEIRLPEGPPAQPEVGFNASYGFPHMYLGQNIETTVEKLEESGWVVDSSGDDEVELTLNQLALDLRFNPDTGVVTYTRLIDLT